MTEHIPASEPRAAYSIDQAALLTWFNETADEVEAQQVRHADLLQRHPGLDQDPTMLQIQGEIIGQRRVLNSLAAFLMAHTAERAGKFTAEAAQQTPEH